MDFSFRERLSSQYGNRAHGFIAEYLENALLGFRCLAAKFRNFRRDPIVAVGVSVPAFQVGRERKGGVGKIQLKAAGEVFREFQQDF